MNEILAHLLITERAARVEREQMDRRLHRTAVWGRDQEVGPRRRWRIRSPLARETVARPPAAVPCR